MRDLVFDNLPDTPTPGEIGELLDLGRMPDGHVLQITRPKAGMLIPMADLAVEGTDSEKFREVMHLLKGVLTPESRKYLFGRLSAPPNVDAFDVIHLVPILQALTEVLGGVARPTGSSSESSPVPG